MLTIDSQKTVHKLTVAQWLQIRKDEGSKIDPETAEVSWKFAPTADPDRVYSDLSEEEQQVGRYYFARSPGNDTWVSFHDIPAEARDRLWERVHKERSAKKLAVEQWLQFRKEEGLRIDPETAEVSWHWRPTLDPYGVYPDLPKEFIDSGRQYFARSPGSDIGVSFYDLPDATRKRLWERIQFEGIPVDDDVF